MGGLTHELRSVALHYDEALGLPLPLHLAKQMEEYVLLIDIDEEVSPFCHSPVFRMISNSQRQGVLSHAGVGDRLKRPISYLQEFILRKNCAIACSVYALGFRKHKAFRKVTEEG